MTYFDENGYPLTELQYRVPINEQIDELTRLYTAVSALDLDVFLVITPEDSVLQTVLALAPSHDWYGETLIEYRMAAMARGLQVVRLESVVVEGDHTYN